jgi:hypothetical protein
MRNTKSKLTIRQNVFTSNTVTLPELSVEVPIRGGGGEAARPSSCALSKDCSPTNLRQQVERFDVSGPHYAEVSVVERRQYRDAFTLRYRHNRRVDEAEPEIRVLLDECDRAFVVGHREVDYPNVTRCDETKEGGLSRNAEAPLDEPRRLCNHWHGCGKIATVSAENLYA